MLAAERRRWILDALAREGKVAVADLTDRLAVSHDTVRRDLQGLSAAGLLRRVHGGALPPNLTALDIAERARQAPAAKRALAKKAARLLRNDSVIVLSIGTSAIELAREVPHELKATVFTLSAPIAIQLSSRPGLDVHLIGGRFEPLILETAGVEAVETLRRLRADVCFFGVWALHPQIGLSVGHIDDVPVLQSMIAGAAEVVGLATVDKLGNAEPFVVAPATELTHLVTERSASEALTAPYERAGVTVLRA